MHSHCCFLHVSRTPVFLFLFSVCACVCVHLMYERSNTLGTFCNWEQMWSRLCVSGKKPYGCVFYFRTRVFTTRAVIAAPRPARSALRCAREKSWKTLIQTPLRHAKTWHRWHAAKPVFSPHRSVSSSPPLPRSLTLLAFHHSFLCLKSFLSLSSIVSFPSLLLCLLFVSVSLYSFHESL